jgi:exonuclease III
VPCDIRDKHKAYIDDILIDQKLAARGQNKRFVRLPFAFDDRDKQLSDHCPVVFSLEPIKR